MTTQSINTPRVADAANRLNNTNNAINSRFNNLATFMLRLENWQSPGGSAANTVRGTLPRINEARSTVLQNYATLLMQQVNPNYQAAEEANTSLADKFR